MDALDASSDDYNKDGMNWSLSILVSINGPFATITHEKGESVQHFFFRDDLFFLSKTIVGCPDLMSAFDRLFRKRTNNVALNSQSLST